MKPHLIGISGKIGSGKNYFAEKVTDVLISKGFTVKEASFATPLKREATDIIKDFSLSLNDDTFMETMVVEFSKKYNMTFEQIEMLYSFVAKELEENPNLNGYSRSEGLRRFLQYLGTDVRRNTEENYWVDRFSQFIPQDCNFVFITDVRFPNEADCVLNNEGTLIRVDVSSKTIKERTSLRDNLSYSAEALTHPSETALDNFPSFTRRVGETFNVEEEANLLTC